jgi:hypothetical protein
MKISEALNLAGRYHLEWGQGHGMTCISLCIGDNVSKKFYMV